MNKTITNVLNKVRDGKDLTEREAKIYQNFINDVGGERPQEAPQAVTESDSLADLLEDAPTEQTTLTVTAEAPKVEGKKLTLAGLAEIQKGYDTLSKHDKLKTASGSNLDIMGRLAEEGIYGIFEGKKAKNDIGTHYIGFALPTLDGLDYRNAYKELAATYRKNPTFAKHIKDNAQGEIITIAGYGGLFLNFIRPYGEAVTIEGMDGKDLTITKENWHNEPLAVWANGGRMIKVFHTLGMINLLEGNYLQKPSDKFQLDKRDIRTRHWLHFEKRGDQHGLITKNGNFKPIPNNLQSGWAPIIEWAQGNI